MRYSLLVAALVLVASPIFAQEPQQLARAIASFEAGQYASARRALDQLRETQPGNAQVAYYLGRVDFAAGEFGDAEDRFKDAIELHEQNAEFHYWLGRTYHERMQRAGMLSKGGFARRAIRSFESAVRLDAELIGARTWLAQYYWDAPRFVGGDKNKARAQVAEITRRDPIAGHTVMGSIYWDDEEWANAETEYRAILAVDSAQTDAWYMLGRIYQQTEQYDKALEAFEGVVHMDSTVMGAWYQIGRTGALSGQGLDRAVEAFQFYLAHDVVEGEPSHASAHWRLGMVYEHRCDRTAARREYQSALTLEPEHEQAKDALDKLAELRC